MDKLTAAMREALGAAEVNLVQLSERTGIGYWELYNSLGPKGRGRKLRAEEFMKICRELEWDPWDFIPPSMGRSSK